MKKLSILMILLASGGSVADADGGNSFFPPQLQLGSKTLVFNGTGLRKATLFAVKVYQASLYLEKRSSDPQQILTSLTSKVLRMRFVRDVSANKIRGAFMEGFENNCDADCGALKPWATQLNGWVTDLKDTDTLELDFTSDSVKFLIRGREVGTIKNGAYSKILLATWLGNKPPTEDLKKALLGLGT